MENNETIKAKCPNANAAYALIVRGRDVFWNGLARKHYEGMGKEFDGILFVRKFIVSILIMITF